MEDKNLAINRMELLQQSNRIRLILESYSQTTNRHPIVVIFGEKSVSAIVGLLGTLLSGNAYSFLDIGDPPAAIANALETLKPTAILGAGSPQKSTENFVKKKAKELGIPWVSINVPYGEPPPVTYLPPTGLPKVSPEHIAYVLFSSGSTGIPKGIAISRHAAALAISAYIRDIKLNSRDVVAGLASLRFDVSVFDLFSSLWTGARLRLIQPKTDPALPDFHDCALPSETTVIFTIPSIVSTLMESKHWPNGSNHLRCLALTGERITSSFVDELRRRLPRETEVWNMYGGTEMPYVFAAPINTDTTNANVFGIDTRHPNLEPGLDGNFSTKQIEPGQSGSLWVRGAPIMSGYVTREDGWPTLNKKGTHNTGDIFRIRSDGKWALVGRKDRQVRIQGFRVELDSVESWIETHPAIAACLVALVPGTQEVHAAIELEANANQQAVHQEFYRHCEQGLPAYMMPSRLHWVKNIPRTGSGKKDYFSSLRLFIDG